MITKIINTSLIIFIFVSGLTVGTYLIKPTLFVATPTVTAQQQTPVGKPHGLFIPELGLAAQIEPVGEDFLGRMALPTEIDNVSWWEHGAKPGQTGTAVLAGHVDTPTGDYGIFYPLYNLKPGDQIQIVDVYHQYHVYQVVANHLYDTADFPIDLVFSTQQFTSQLNLITCWGTYDLSQNDYTQRLVIFAELMKS